MAFDPDKYLQEKTGSTNNGFDPDKYLSEKMPTEKTTALDAFHKNASDSALLGYGPQVRAGLIDPLVEKVGNFFTGNDVDMGDYLSNRDSYRKEIDTSKAEHPGMAMAGTVTGALATSLVPGLNAAKGVTAGARVLNAAKTGAVMGGIMNPGDTEGEYSGLQLPDRIMNAGTGALVSGGLQGAGEGVIKGAGYLKDKGAAFFRKGAEELAENATGATRVQAEKFRDGSGRYLLDNKIVGFGDNADDIAGKANSAISKAEKGIDDSLNALDSHGAQVSQDKIIDSLQKQISDLSKDPSKADVVKKLNNIIDDIINTGESNLSTSSAEQAKRGFNKMAKNWQDPEKGEAGKIAYRAYRDAVENAAEAADPAIANTFKKAKDTFGRLSPIADAAEKRAKQLNQSPVGGLLDTAAVIGGAIGGDDPLSGGAMGLGTALMRRKLAPRAAASMAVTFDKISKTLLSQSPRLQKLAAQNPKAYGAMVFNLVERMESKGGGVSMPRAAENPDNQSSLQDRYNSNPDFINNEKLKEQLEKQRLKKQVPVKEARAAFIQGN